MTTLLLLFVLALILAGAAGALVVLRRNAGLGGASTAPSTRGIDPFTLNDPWRRFAQSALNAQRRFDDAVADAAAGPLKDRLTEIGRSLDEGVQRTWATAQKGQSLREARRRIDTNRVDQRLAGLGGGEDPSSVRMAESLRSQLDSARRLDEITAGAELQLRLLQAQLEESVARVAELSVRAGDVSLLAGVENDIDHVSQSLEALRLALEETNGGSAAVAGDQ